MRYRDEVHLQLLFSLVEALSLLEQDLAADRVH